MRKEQKVALALAGILALNTLPGCANKNNNNMSSSTTSLTEQEKQYKVENLYVCMSKSIDGDDIPYIIKVDKGYYNTHYYEALTHVELNKDNLSYTNSTKLLDFLTLDELKNFLNESELKNIYGRLRTDGNDVKLEEFKFEGSANKDENIYYTSKICICEAIMDNEEKELYIFDIANEQELFTRVEVRLSHRNAKYNIFDFIEYKDYKERYTESELKEILKYARYKYHNIESTKSLDLTK